MSINYYDIVLLFQFSARYVYILLFLLTSLPFKDEGYWQTRPFLSMFFVIISTNSIIDSDPLPPQIISLFSVELPDLVFVLLILKLATVERKENAQPMQLVACSEASYFHSSALSSHPEPCSPLCCSLRFCHPLSSSAR